MTSPTSDRRLGLVGNTAIKAPVACATTANITLSGEQTIDGVLTSSSRVLVKDQTNTVENGIYDSSSGSWTRSFDFNGNYDIVKGTLVGIAGGTQQDGAYYEVTSANPITVGTSAITFSTSVAIGSLATQLASVASPAYGAGMVGRAAQVVDSIAALRALLKTSPSAYAFVTGYYAAGDGGGGDYYYDSSDTTTADNGGTIIVATDGGRWKLVTKHNVISVKQFGAKGDYVGGAIAGQNDTTAIQAAIDWAQSNVNTVTYGSYSPSVGTGVVYFPQGSYGVNAALSVTTKICFLGEGQSEFTYGSRLTQTAANTDLIKIAAGAGGTSFSIEKMTLRSNYGTGTGHLVNMVRTGGGSVNSQRYIECTFAQPQAMSLYLAHDDIVIKNCLFDVSSNGSGDCIQLGTAASAATHVRIEGCNFYNVENSCIKLVNVNGLSVSGNTMSQPNITTKTPYFIDAISTTPTAAENITVSANTLRGPRTAFGGTDVSNVTITGNTMTEAGIGTGETMHLFMWDGTCTNVVLRNNSLRGSYENMNFWNSASATAVTGSIGGNSFVNDGGAGDAFALSNYTGKVDTNYFDNFTNYQISQKVNTTGAAVDTGVIGAGATVTYGPIDIIGAALGDKVQCGSMSGGWVAVAGVEMVAYCNDANEVTVAYRNGTAGGITPAAHDIWVEATR